MIEGSYFGHQKFSFDGTGKDLITRSLVHVALSLPTFFLCWIWYWARVQRYYAEHTSLQAARFRSTLTGGGVLALWVGNAILFIITLGLGWSWITVRSMRYYASHLTMVGVLDVDAVAQDAHPADSGLLCRRTGTA